MRVGRDIGGCRICVDSFHLRSQQTAQASQLHGSRSIHRWSTTSKNPVWKTARSGLTLNNAKSMNICRRKQSLERFQCLLETCQSSAKVQHVNITLSGSSYRSYIIHRYCFCSGSRLTVSLPLFCFIICSPPSTYSNLVERLLVQYPIDSHWTPMSTLKFHRSGKNHV